ncbi:MAG: glycosyl transferase family 2, partial [Actinomycetia bacterium]|nr:glycosyl transferase family 2 [Actinomycetes bacterium]
RIRAGGGLIWFTPELKVTYRPRATLYTLAHQHFRYGRWRRVVARRYPETVNRRYLAPPVAAAASLAGAVLGVIGAVGWGIDAPHYVTYLAFGFVIPVGYLAAVTGAAALLARELPPPVRARVPLVLATMHMTWGLGFLTSPRRLARRATHSA